MISGNVSKLMNDEITVTEERSDGASSKPNHRVKYHRKFGHFEKPSKFVTH